jgi:hypothetical protein
MEAMDKGLSSYLNEIPVFDVHEHHMPEMLSNPRVGLIQLLEESYCAWAKRRPYPLPNEPPFDLKSSVSGRGSWKDIAGFVVESGANAFVRNMIRSLAELYDLGEPGITEQNWTRLDEEIRRNHADTNWNAVVLGRAGIKTVVSDPYQDPLLDIRKVLGSRYYSVLRINAFAVGWHPDSRDHNGNSAQELLARLGLEPSSYDEYREALSTVVSCLPSRNKVGLKNALAYDRSLNFDDLDEDAARRAWGQRNPDEHEKKAFGDCVVDTLCRLAGERGIPFQMHMGSALISGSRPLNAVGLIERNPRTRFLLMHLGYPWSGELLGMAFVYRNIWIDLSWSWLLSPSQFVHSLHEAIDVLPDESRMMVGGDTWHVEETYGAITAARRLIASVLDDKVKSGYFLRADAERLGRKILWENGEAFFGLCS